MANKIYYSPTALTGGGASALDFIDGATLTDGDFAHVTMSGIIYVYKLNGTLGGSESSPQVIVPDTNPGTKCWVLQRQFYSSQQLLDNLSFTATVGSKALTVSLKGADGVAPSTSNPVSIGFRSATLTDGKPVIRTVTAATSVVLPSGGTLGFTAAEAGRLYVWAIDNAGTVELALSRTADIFPEGNLVTTVAIGSGSDSATAMYSTTQRTSLACRCIGYIEITTGGTAGEWDNAATKVQVMGPGVKRTGDIVQVISYRTNTKAAVGTTALPLDDTTPVITEGNLVMAQAITPTSAINKLIVRAYGWGCVSAALNYGFVFFRSDTEAPIGSKFIYHAGADLKTPFNIETEILAGTASAFTISLQGGNSAGNNYFFLEDTAAGGFFNLTSYGGIIIEEVFQ